MPLIPPPPKPGQIVRIRQRQYLVDEVVEPPVPGDATLVKASCVDDDAQGQPLEALWEIEVDPEILTAESWQDLGARGFDPPRMFSAYYHTLRWNCVTATDPKLFQSPFRAGIKIDAYQLEPLRKALLLPRVNLFIADDVGIGKTIEAGLIGRELLLRKKVSTIVVAAPPSMIPQWQGELEARFGLTFEVLDRSYVARVRQERGYGINPWDTHSRFLISQRLLVDEAYAGPLRDWLGELRPGSLLILDEAHHAAPASGTRYAIDSKITRAVRDLAQRFEHRLFLSATPHNGHSNSFSALLEILDPQRFCRGVPVKGKALLDDVMVRRLKDDIREVQGGFPKRQIVQIDIDHLPADAPELVLSKLLDDYRQLRERRLRDESRRTQAAAGLLICGLQVRLLSSIEAFARTLRVHRRTVERQWDAWGANKPLPAGRHTGTDLITGPVAADDDRAVQTDEENQAEEAAQVEAVTIEAAGSLEQAEARVAFQQERQLLEEMERIAQQHRARPDARVRALLDWVREHMCRGLPPLGMAIPPGPAPTWNNTRIIVFTEFEDTRRYLQHCLTEAIAGTDRAERRIEVYSGQTPQAVREEIKRAFNGDPKIHPIRILIATDAAREGLNLQTRCHNLFHLDVPWNPARMEQRNGRIDRKLQPAAEVFCHYFVYQQRPEDRVLRALVRKTDTIRKELGSLSQVIESRLATTLKRGIRRTEVARLEFEIDEADLEAGLRLTVEEELEESRDRQDKLRRQIDGLRTRLNDARRWIGLTEEHFRSAISSALELVGAPALQKLPPDAGGGANGQWAFPALDQRQGADPTWVDTMDTLRKPRERDQKPWDWRRESPIRPIVFEDPGTLDDAVVHLHLEQRVVQRLLGRFTAQGFVLHDMSRACLAQTTDAIPRVLLFGRLCLYGPGAARLHEELITVAARWIDPPIRKGPLHPFARDGEQRSLELFDEALLKTASRPVPPVRAEQLQQAAPRDIADLVPHLELRGHQLAEEATRRLADRGEAEAQAMRGILEAQQKRIGATLEQHWKTPLGLDPEETRQFEANRRHWAARKDTIVKELATEPTRIRALYDIQAVRIDPVGLVYLWPVTG